MKQLLHNLWARAGSALYRFRQKLKGLNDWLDKKAGEYDDENENTPPA